MRGGAVARGGRGELPHRLVHYSACVRKGGPAKNKKKGSGALPALVLRVARWQLSGLPAPQPDSITRTHCGICSADTPAKQGAGRRTRNDNERAAGGD
eukprot:scaffold6743_cov118-Isochrysis_galbana.AAC.10